MNSKIIIVQIIANVNVLQASSSYANIFHDFTIKETLAHVNPCLELDYYLKALSREEEKSQYSSQMLHNVYGIQSQLNMNYR